MSETRPSPDPALSTLGGTGAHGLPESAGGGPTAHGAAAPLVAGAVPGAGAAPRLTPARFAALCRSSPWRWDTLRFRLYWTNRDQPAALPVRAWLRRPDSLRVETLQGRRLYTTTSLTRSRDDFYVSSTAASWLLPPALVAPVYDDTGLVERRPEAAYGDPVFGGERWQAVLDPVECAGPAPVPRYLVEQRPTALSTLTRGRFADRPVWCATVAPRTRYAPVTPGHPLVPGRTRIAVDTETGVCVYSAVMDGPAAGQGHRLVIEAVDEYLLDDLFTPVDFNLTDVSRHVPWPLRADDHTS